MEHKGQPTVILAKTVKGYGLGEAGEGRNISHQQKKMNEKELREFRARFNIPITDEEIADMPFYQAAARTARRSSICWIAAKSSAALCRSARSRAPKIETPKAEEFGAGALKGSGSASALHDRWRSWICSANCCATKRLAAALFRSFLTKRARSASTRCSASSASIRRRASFTSRWITTRCSYYHEAKDGQILEEGITEAGSMASFIARARPTRTSA